MITFVNKGKGSRGLCFSFEGYVSAVVVEGHPDRRSMDDTSSVGAEPG